MSRVSLNANVDLFSVNELDGIDIQSANSIISSLTTDLVQVGALQVNTLDIDQINALDLSANTLILSDPIVITNPLTVGTIESPMPQGPAIIRTGSGAPNIQTMSVGNIETPLLSTPQINATIYSTDTYTVDTLTVNSIHITNLNSTDVDAQNVTADNTTTTTSTVTDITGTQLNSAEYKSNTTTTSNAFTYNDTAQSQFYSTPVGGAFKGVCFFKDLDIGFGSVGTLIAMNMRSISRQPYMDGYNTFLGALDKSTGFGGVAAILSLCAPTTPARTLRWEVNGNLSIYSDHTLIWQNGMMISDRRLKKNIMPIESAMDKILRINGVVFDYNFHPYERSAGVVFEQVVDVFPQCTTKTGLVHLEKLVPLIVEGLKELKLRNQLIMQKING